MIVEALCSVSPVSVRLVTGLMSVSLCRAAIIGHNGQNPQFRSLQWDLCNVSEFISAPMAELDARPDRSSVHGPAVQIGGRGPIKTQP